jgi:predicted secreted protein
MKITATAVALAFGLIAVPASAQDAQSAESAEEEPKEEKKICRTDRATGSLTRRTRVCLTAAQWRELNSRTKRGMDEMQRSASGSMAIPNNPGG